MEQSFLNCSKREDFEFLFDMFSANIYEAIHTIVESDEVAEKILADTFIKIRNQHFAYDQNYIGIFTMLLRTAIELSYCGFEDSKSKKTIYQKLGHKIAIPALSGYSKTNELNGLSTNR